MKKLTIVGLLVTSALSGSVFADQPLLNNVSYQVTEQQWVKASQATASIAINATVSDQNIASLRASIMKNLQQFASGDWHITQFSRTKTSSGLQSINASAQIQLPADQLNQISSRVKSVSCEGQTYSVANLDFNPTRADKTAAETILREKVYKDIQAEIQTLDKQFPQEHYFAHQVNFMSGYAPMPRTVALVKMAANGSPNVSQKATLTARVVLSSKVNGNSGN